MVLSLCRFSFVVVRTQRPCVFAAVEIPFAWIEPDASSWEWATILICTFFFFCLAVRSSDDIEFNRQFIEIQRHIQFKFIDKFNAVHRSICGPQRPRRTIAWNDNKYSDTIESSESIQCNTNDRRQSISSDTNSTVDCCARAKWMAQRTSAATAAAIQRYIAEYVWFTERFRCEWCCQWIIYEWISTAAKLPKNAFAKWF